eukprot:TRINITY_DN7577_c0_g1_i1.p1 TRINITY_DN7577_c0_g1~~TRINITY_DN7577_c0_g1_i1.p1  ORF type:complete len:322 (-),score=84.84 TRINITY_DN7577_c0_g1_i1:92-976(-)
MSSSRPRRAAAAAAPKYVEDGSEDSVSEEEKPTRAKKAVASKKRSAPTETPAEAPEEVKRPKSSDNDEAACEAALSLDANALKAALSAGADATKVLGAACQDSQTKGRKKPKVWFEIIKMIVEAGADVTVGPIVTNVICGADAPEIVKYLIDKGAKDHPPMAHDETERAWFYCGFWDRPLCGQVLLDAGWASLTPGSLDIEAGLNRAIWLGNMKFLKFLLDKKVDVNFVFVKHHTGDTPLTSAISSPLKPKQQVERVEMLLAAGADKKLKDGHGQTALEVAKAKKKKDIIPLLE